MSFASLRSFGSAQGMLCVSLLFLLCVHRGECADDIPFDSLTETNRALVKAVTDHYTLRREYPAQRIKARAAHLLFLMDHMEACSILAHKTKLITYRARTDDTGRIWADNHEGSKGFILPVHASDGKRVYYVAGSQRGLFEARGRGVAVVDYQVVDADTIEYTGQLFVKVDNAVLAALAQVFQMFVTGQVDKNFEHVMRHPIQLSRWALEDPPKLRDAIRGLPAEDQRQLTPFQAMLPAP